jgi:hypothetical protein
MLTKKSLFFWDCERFRHTSQKKHSFSKVFSVFHFWTFLKMSNFQNLGDFYRKIQKYISGFRIFGFRISEFPNFRVEI